MSVGHAEYPSLLSRMFSVMSAPVAKKEYTCEGWKSIIQLQRHYQLIDVETTKIIVYGVMISNPLQDDNASASVCASLRQTDFMTTTDCDKVVVFRDHSTASMLAAGVGAAVGWHKRNAFYRKVEAAVAVALTHSRVVLVGISYGGMIAGMVAERFKNDPRGSRLHLRTFGSIYRPSREAWNQDHYVRYGDDLAKLMCGLQNPEDKSADATLDPDTRTVWLPNKPEDEALAPSGARTVAGALSNKRSRAIHNSYGVIFFNVLKNFVLGERQFKAGKHGMKDLTKTPVDSMKWMADMGL